MNTLAQRLKFAKRELTALKTAHRRGLGNLRVYRRNELLTPPYSERDIYVITIKLSFSSNFAPFPYIQVVQGAENPSIPRFIFEDFEYYSDGMGATVVASGLFDSGSPSMPYEILSLAPVTNIETDWRIYG